MLRYEEERLNLPVRMEVVAAEYLYDTADAAITTILQQVKTTASS